MESEALESCSGNMEAHGLAIVLPSLAKAFLRPQHYGEVLAAIRREGWSLFVDNVIVQPGLEATDIDILKRIVKPKKGARSEVTFSPAQGGRVIEINGDVDVNEATTTTTTTYYSADQEVWC
jgi:hypothetical protein